MKTKVTKPLATFSKMKFYKDRIFLILMKNEEIKEKWGFLTLSVVKIEIMVNLK